MELTSVHIMYKREKKKKCKCIIILFLAMCILNGCNDDSISDNKPQKTNVEYDIAVTNELLEVLSIGKELVMLKDKSDIVSACEKAQKLGQEAINSLQEIAVTQEQKEIIAETIDTLISYVDELNRYIKSIESNDEESTKESLLKIKDYLVQLNTFNE